MQLPALLISDPHFTANPKDEYRWTIWKWLAAQCAEERVKTLIFGGDLTDAKDYHSSTLVNRLVLEVYALSKIVPSILILQGNHDYLREDHSYFSFLSVIPGVCFITKPREVMLDGGPAAMFMPHNKNPAKAWAGLDFSHYDLLFIHQTIKGAIASNGQEMEGESMPALNAGKVWSGDIHVPQIIGPIEYIGSPYHVHFGDRFKPRCVLLDRRGKAHDLHFETLSRISLRIQSLDELKAGQLREGDQVKVTIELSQSEKHEWPKLKREAEIWLREKGVLLEGVEMALERPSRRFSIPARGSQAHARRKPSEVVESFVRAEGLTAEALDVGLDLLS